MIGGGGRLLALDGAVLTGTRVSDGAAVLAVGSGQLQGTVLSAGGTLSATRGSLVSQTAVYSGAGEYVASGSVAVGTQVEAGGAQWIADAGVASGSTIRGEQVVFFNGFASAAVIGSGGRQLLVGDSGISASGGGLAIGTTVNSGGMQTVSAGARAAGTAVNAGGLLVLGSGGTASGTSVAGGTVMVSSGATTFATSVGSGGRQVVMAGGTVSGTTLAIGGMVDLQDLAFASGGSATLNSVTNVLTVSQGGQTTTLGLAGLYSGRYFHLNQDTDGSTLVTQDTNPACYAHGTLIATDRGEVPVEALGIGDVVVTATGAHRTIRWLGRRAYAGRFLRANPGVQPVRFHAGSLGEGLPRRDLLVSPNHAMLLDGVLVPAGALVNGRSIIREQGPARVDYVHVELDSHDVLLAEGAPSESFVDDDSRGTFHNAAEWAQLYPGHTSVAALYCAPRVEHGPALEAIRRRLGGLAHHQAARCTASG